MRSNRRDHISPVLVSLHWLSVFFLTYKALNDKVPSYPKYLILKYSAFRCQTAGLLVVPRVSKSRMGGRAFSYQAPLCGTSCQFGFRKQTPSLPLRLGLKILDKAYS